MEKTKLLHLKAQSGEDTVYGAIKMPPIVLEGIHWGSTNTRQIYRTLKETGYTLFPIEVSLKSKDWTVKWSKWQNRHFNNKLKIIMHTNVSDQFSSAKYRNKSGNCPFVIIHLYNQGTTHLSIALGQNICRSI